MSRMLSGIKPSGELTIGNYAGALHQFISFAQTHECLFFVPDLHAITVPQPPRDLYQRSKEVAAYYVAAGIDPNKSTIFIQSQVPAHAELGWLMETQVYFGELGRMTQFKDKSEGKDAVSASLFTYPALMAADILLYEATHVPVGEDQKQHLELTRDLAARFNNRFGPVFTLPEPIIPGIGSRVMGLDDPAKKMSKSNPNQNSFVQLQDPPDAVRKKFARAVTDSELSVRYDWERKPAVSNLIEIYAVFSGDAIPDIERRYEGQGYGAFKKDLAEVVLEKLLPLQARYADIIHSAELDRILKTGAEQARELAAKTLLAAKRAMGLVT